jgi:hypothetical protein
LFLSGEVGHVESESISLDLKSKGKLQVLNIAEDKLVNIATLIEDDFHGDGNLRFRRNCTLVRFKINDETFRVVNFFPHEFSRDVSIVLQDQVLMFVFA